MTNPERPSSLSEAMLIARKATDPRDEFQVYRDIARVLVHRKLDDWLKQGSIASSLKSQIIEAEANSMAQPAHLSDASSNKPIHLLGMLEELGVIRPERHTSE